MASKIKGIIDPNVAEIYRKVLSGWKIEEVKERYNPVGRTFKVYSPTSHTSWRIWLLPSDWWR